MTILAWGGIIYEQGYIKAGMLNYLRDAVKWGTDYFIKCHVADNEFYGQVDILIDIIFSHMIVFS